MPSRDFSDVEETLKTGGTPDQRAVLLASLQAIGAGQFEALPGYFTDEVELTVRGFAGLAGSWRGRAEVVAALAKGFATVTEQKPQILAMIEQGDAIAVRFRETGRSVATQQTYHAEAVMWCTFAGGQIQRIEEFVELVF